MFDRILVPLDGSPTSDGILTQVRRLVARPDVELWLLRVMPESAFDRADPVPERVSEDVMAHLDRLRADLEKKGGSVHAEMRTGDPAREILARIAELHPDLVAMSSRGRTGAARWLLGSVTERVMQACPAPLLVANRRALAGRKPTEARFQRILVPLDGSEASGRILPLVQAMAGLYRAEVILLHVSDRVVGRRAEKTPSGVRPLAKALAEKLEQFRRTLESGGVAVRLEIAVDVAAACILDRVRSEKADLVALTTHGAGGAVQWAFGSVATKVLHECPVPLLLLRTGGPR